ncbi:Alkylated DNA repair protein alkB homolog 1-like Protein [Tribolium castaneum]|uniref:Alkylated DNA repair protein alkB homolog 1-like Protein n=1 Tax=Tribolium castaneum TaxID=7070 RepID=D2A2Y9_TRICA|nr:Alkylated DNA repair protein alkB homolog 1-like Protein [Tribolium castaneum]
MFKDCFKYYKSKNPPPDLEKVRRINLEKTGNSASNFGLNPVKTWEVYELVDHPGLIFIKNPFTSIGQRYWVVRCLQDYSKRPNKTNLDALNLVPEGKEWWEVCQNNNNKILMNKLRWVTLGYHHDWESKVYAEENKGEFPKDLAELSRFIAESLNFLHFNAEAAIVNYYHMDSTLSGHTDHSEHNLKAPLISLSFGQTAIFLLGGKTKDDEPSAMFLRSGDIVVMSEESRLCYHGVPKILQMDSRFWNCFEENDFTNDCKNVVNICKEETLWKPFGDYLNNSRININVRQVLQRGQKRLCSESDEKT